LGNKIFFASDFHLGIDATLSSLEREKNIVRWLDSIEDEAEEIYLVGDVFDYWFEYKSVVPRGFSRFFGKIASLRDKGIPIHLFTGNHDMWLGDYFQKEYGIQVFRDPIIRDIQGKKLFIGHGDGLGPGDRGYKFIKAVFRNSLCQWAFARLHPNFALGIMKRFSQKSRDVGDSDAVFYGREEEMLIQYSERKLETIDIDYFIFGHRHLPLDVDLKTKESKYYGLGDWTHYQSYGVMNDGVFSLEYFESEPKTVIVK